MKFTGSVMKSSLIITFCSFLFSLVAAVPEVRADNNLVQLGNFERFSRPWGTGQYSSYGLWWCSRGANAKARAVRLSQPVYGIRTALRINNQSTRAPHVYGNTSQRISAKPNTDYRISLWAAAQNLRSNGAVNIAYEVSWTKRPICLKGGTYKWSYYAATLNTGVANYIDLRIISEDVGSVLITGIMVHEIHDGIAHIQYDLASGATVNAFIFDPSQLIIYRSSPSSGGDWYADIVRARGLTVLVNGTYIGGKPTQAFGDFVLNNSLGRYNGASSLKGKNLIQFLNDRYYFAVDNSLQGILVGGRIASRSNLKWAIGGLGGLLYNGRFVHFERNRSTRLFNGIDGNSSIARSAIGFTWDGKIILMTTGNGSTRKPGASIRDLATELLRLGAKHAAALDGGSATFAYYRYASPSLVANPRKSYTSNYSFVGAKPLSGATKHVPPASTPQSVGPTMTTTPRPRYP